MNVMIMKMIRILKRSLNYLVLSKAERRHRLVGPPKLWKMKREFQIKFLKEMGLRPEHYLLDIGCGTLRGGIPLIEYLDQGHYYGTDSRSQVLDQGRMEIREANLDRKKPNLIAVDEMERLSIPNKFDYIWAFSVLIHMSDEVLNNTLSFVKDHLKTDGCFYANVNIGDKQDQAWQGFPIVWRSWSFYKEICSRHGLTVTEIGSLGNHGHVTDDETMDGQRILKIYLPINVKVE